MEKVEEIIQTIKANQPMDLAIALGILILFILISSGFAKLIMRIFKIKVEKGTKKSNIYKSLKFVWIITGIYISLRILNLSADITAIITKIFKLILIYNITKIIAFLIEPNSKIFNKINENKNIKNDNTIKVIVKFARGIIYIIGAFIFISELGYDLSGLVTGLGIGSVVIALAAQDFAKSILGGLSITLDKPFEIGDSIEVKGTAGIVENITFRSTRLRKFDNSVMTIPNSVIADADIINWNKIEKRRFETKLKVSLNMMPQQIDSLTQKIQQELENIPYVINDTARVYFSEIKSDGLVLTIYLYTTITDYDEYMKFANDLNLKILSILEHQNVKLIYPAYDIHELRA